MIDYLKSIDKDELVIFIDAYDVLLLKPLDDIEEVFNNITKISGKKIIISCENNNFLNKIGSYINYGFCKSLFINAGTYMGKANDILNMLIIITSIDYNDTNDDQLLLTNYCEKFNDIFFIDHDINIFLVITNSINDILEFPIIIKNDNLFINNSQPYFIHGNFNTLLDNLIKKLGYNITDNEINDNYNYYNLINKYIYYIKKLFFEYITCLLLLFLIIYIIIRKYYIV